MTQVRETVRECDCFGVFRCGEGDELVRCVHVGSERVALIRDFENCYFRQDGVPGLRLRTFATYDYESALAAFAKAEQELLESQA